jgi:hypothetical protein
LLLPIVTAHRYRSKSPAGLDMGPSGLAAHERRRENTSPAKVLNSRQIMTPYELIDIAQSIAARIDVQWGFFLTIHMALLGGIIYVDRPLSPTEKTIAIALYSVFAVMNFRVLRLQQTLLETAYQDLVALKDDACCMHSELIGFYVKLVNWGFGERIGYIAVGLHVLAFAVVVLSIVTDKARRSGSRVKTAA